MRCISQVVFQRLNFDKLLLVFLHAYKYRFALLKMRFCWIIVVHKMTTKRQSSRVKSSVGRGSDVISLPQPSRVNVCLCQLFSTGSCLHAEPFFSCAKNVAVGA